MRHLDGIDGLRAIAVCSVIVFHFASSWLPGGFVGVDVFFVISGFVVTASLLRSDQIQPGKYFASFYARRLLRIYPALLVCIFVTAVVYTLLVPQAYISQTNSKTGLAAYFGLSNFALVAFNDGYFSPRVEFNAFTHTWSLAVEEQFYLIFPVVLMMFLVRPDRSIKNTGFWVLVLLIVGSLAWSAWESQNNSARAYYLLPSRFWELGAGCLLAIVFFRRWVPGVGAGWASIFVSVGLLGVAVSAFITDKEYFPFPGAILPVLSAVLIIYGVASRPTHGVAFHVLGSRLFAYIGRLSYSLYLWHWPVIVILRWTIGDESSQSLALAIFITFALAALSYHLIENPVKGSDVLSVRGARFVLITGGVGVFACAALTALVFFLQEYIALTVTKDRVVWQPDELWGDHNFTTAENRRTLFLLGDSHAWAYSDLVAYLNRDGLVNVERHTVFGCSNANFRTPVSDECKARMMAVIQDIKRKAKPGDFVLLASLKMPRVGDQWVSFDRQKVLADHYSLKAENGRLQAFAQAEEVVGSLTAAGLKVVMDAPKPVMPSPAFRCSDWFNRGNPICEPGFQLDRAYLMELRRPILGSMRLLQSKYSGVYIWDNFDVLCKGAVCSAFDGSQPLFFDGDHLSGHANRLLLPHFKGFLKSSGLI